MKKKKSNYYFTQETENAIEEYNNSESTLEKNKIYREKLKYPIEKLVENVFNTFKFEYFLDDPYDVQVEVVSFIILNLHKYKKDKGKAFSYFSVAAKNYLILNNNKNFKINKVSENIDESDELLNLFDEAEYKKFNSHMDEFMEIMNSFWDKKIPLLFDKDRDIKIAYSIIELFKYIDVIESYNKKNIYLLIREMSGYNGQYITPVLKKMKPLQNELWQNFLSTSKF